MRTATLSPPARMKSTEPVMNTRARAPLIVHQDEVPAPGSTPDKFSERRWRGYGSWADAERIARENHPDDIRKQIPCFFENGLPAGTGRPRQAGNRRGADVPNTLQRLVTKIDDEARECGDDSLRLRNTTDLCERHIVAILRWFSKHKTKRSTIHTCMSSLRRFYMLLGRGYLVPPTHELVELAAVHDIELDLGTRSHVAYAPLAWSAIVRVEPVLQAIKKRDEHAYLLCMLCRAFGLRIKEVISLRPFESDQGDRLWICRGSKGGRQRYVPLSEDPARRAHQRTLLEKAKEACGHDRLHLGFGSRNLQQALAYFESVLNECGVSQRQLGIKAHGLRHDYCIYRFEELTGLPAPILRQAPVAAYKSHMSLVRSARKQIAEELGHGRTNVVSAYIGSLPMLREEEKQTKLAGQIVQQHLADLDNFGVEEVTVAVRKTAAEQQTCVLYFRFADASHAQGVCLVERVRQAARKWLARSGRKVDVLLATPPAQAGMVTIRIKNS